MHLNRAGPVRACGASAMPPSGGPCLVQGAPATASVDAQHAPKNGQVVMGTCGWSSSDAPWSKPPTGTAAADKLRMYSGPAIGFGCVEVDTTTYQIVNPAHVAKWCAATPPGFMFCFKMFGFICAKGGQLGGQFPRDIQEKLPGPLAHAPKGTRVDLHEVPAAVVDEIWERFHESIEPARAAGKLGPVLFQFHLGFLPGDASRAHVEWCRARLGADIRMAVDFRDRAWVEGPQLGATVRWLRKLDIALAASDDLQHELTGDVSGGARVRLPIIARVATPLFAFARVHRRAGSERLLDGNEIAEWASLLRRSRDGGAAGADEVGWVGDEPDPALAGPIFFFWGTDHKDQCVTNAAALQEALGEQSFNWKQYLKELQANSKGGLAGFLAKGRQRHDAESRLGDDARQDGRVKANCTDKRPRRTTNVGATHILPACTDSATDGTANKVGNDGGDKPAFTTTNTAEPVDCGSGVDMCAGAGSATGAGGRAVAQPCPSQSTAASIGRSNGIVPPAREAAFLKMQDRAAECDRSVVNVSLMRSTDCCLYAFVAAMATSDPAVFRTLPREIRAELVTAWWDARADVIAARKWAKEIAEKQHRGHQKRGRKEDVAGISGSASVKRGRRVSDIGCSSAGGAQARSIRDFMS